MPALGEGRIVPVLPLRSAHLPAFHGFRFGPQLLEGSRIAGCVLSSSARCSLTLEELLSHPPYMNFPHSLAQSEAIFPDFLPCSSKDGAKVGSLPNMGGGSSFLAILRITAFLSAIWGVGKGA
eukprot:5893843-Amphidinium_carterae.1